MFGARFGVDDGETADAGGDEAEERAEDEPGVGCAHAEVGAEAEGEVGIGFAVEADLVGVREGGVVEVGGGPAERDAAACGDGLAVEFGGSGADPADVGEGHEDAEEFLAGVGDACGVLADPGEGFGVFGEPAKGAGDGVDDGVAAAGEGEVGEAHHFVAGEMAALVFGGGEGAEEVVAWGLQGAVELSVEVVFEGDAFFEGAGDFEDVDAPADPCGGFGFGDVEEIGEGVGLDGEGEGVDDFEGGELEGGVEVGVDEVFDAGDEVGVFGALEEGVGDFAVGGVFGGVGFDGELAHAADVFFRGDGDAEGGVGAEGVPVLGGGADVFVAEEHEDVLAFEGAAEDAGVAAGGLEGVGERGHGSGGGVVAIKCGRAVGKAKGGEVRGDEKKSYLE